MSDKIQYTLKVLKSEREFFFLNKYFWFHFPKTIHLSLFQLKKKLNKIKILGQLLCHNLTLLRNEKKIIVITAKNNYPIPNKTFFWETIYFWSVFRYLCDTFVPCKLVKNWIKHAFDILMENKINDWVLMLVHTMLSTE